MTAIYPVQGEGTEIYVLGDTAQKVFNFPLHFTFLVKFYIQRAKANVKYFPPSTLATRVIPTPLVTVMASGLESDSESKVL